METLERIDWYVVFTAFRAERCVKRRLDAMGIENRFPVRGKGCMWGRNGVEIQFPLFCGFLFVRVRYARLSEVLAVKNVLTVLQKEGKPFPVSHEKVVQFCDGNGKGLEGLDEIFVSR